MGEFNDGTVDRQKSPFSSFKIKENECECDDDLTVKTVDTVGIEKALKGMRSTRLGEESMEECLLRMKEAKERRRRCKKLLSDKRKLYSSAPELHLNSIDSLREQATIVYNKKCARARSRRSGAIELASTLKKLGGPKCMFPGIVSRIVQEEQDIIDKGIDRDKLLALERKKDKERFKSAREKLEEKKRLRAQVEKEKSEQEVHMPVPGS